MRPSPPSPSPRYRRSRQARSTAGAVSTDQYDRVHVMCGNDDDDRHAERYGNSEQSPRICRAASAAYYDFTESGEYGGFVAVSVVDENSGPVSCKIYVNGPGRVKVQ